MPFHTWPPLGLLALTLILQSSLLAQDPPAATKPAETVPLTEGVVVRFADVAAGRAVLTADDDFSTRLSKFDLQSRLKTDQDASREAWKMHIAEQVTEWPADERAKVEKIIATLQTKLKTLRLPLPKEVLLIRTTGKEEDDAAYTRANAIVLSASRLRHQPAPLESILTHELFHVLSRNDLATRRALYNIVGFTIGDDIKLPQSLDDRRITNPDAPKLDCYIELKNEERQITAVPLLYATPSAYDPKAGKRFFDYVTFRLLVVDKVDGTWQPRMKEQQPVVLDPKGVDSFFDQIGKNTTYIWHPDEILADNFVHLVNRRMNLATPRITEEMAKVLAVE
jgi:hypothetical protein